MGAKNYLRKLQKQHQILQYSWLIDYGGAFWRGLVGTAKLLFELFFNDTVLSEFEVEN